VELINSGTDQLLQILDDILDISRIEAGQLMIRPELVNLPEIFKNLEKQSQLVLSIKKPGKLILKSEITTAGLPETIFCDPSRLIRVMNNLIDNAIKFTEQGEIVFGYQPCVNRRYIKFYVRDTGIGIRNDQLAVIFERFRQGENSLNRKFGGTGLGLSISKSMVEMMGGNFGVVSEEGKGSEFSFTLPV
jgi:two-component system CheB/CheR fusion protein